MSITTITLYILQGKRTMHLQMICLDGKDGFEGRLLVLQTGTINQEPQPTNKQFAADQRAKKLFDRV
ncbi:MAG TPA: hypothetical protein VJB87_00840, partial [Candidatus Nanoarchaeia archaeon]|nr:hypothetical protein [Candidatus Nanoarchaeia archaeon]